MSVAVNPMWDIAMDTVSLEELTTDAALLTRVDRKYVLPAAELPRVLDQLRSHAPTTRVLDIDGRRAHGYRSIYFDTPARASFLMAAHPRRRKFKLRTRTYLDTGESFLEFKATGPRGVTVKSRFELTESNTECCGSDRLSADAIAWASDLIRESTTEYGVPINAEDLAPVMWGTYDRTTFLLPGGISRCTVDTSLTWQGMGTSVLERPNMVIVETKSEGQPSVMDRVLWRCGYRPAKISKFGTGMAALHPELPHNRWNRVLTQYFQQPTTAPLA